MNPGKNETDHPGVYVPPPFIYLSFYLLSVLLQEILPVEKRFLRNPAMQITGWILMVIGFSLIIPAVKKFFTSGTSLLTVKPATALQTTGIYRCTRNPIYLGMLLLYGGAGFFIGNWWTYILVPAVIYTMQSYVIKREERYLRRAFGNDYLQYCESVRRWI
ncbi:MAG: isoprenylcysteine carboxylmethyltransferase family protein [Chitinophagaceae bacterium]|nr:isoprenylcysteine carboxylmethyltransferase family protein [Chitinophagaceae bacterium]